MGEVMKEQLKNAVTSLLIVALAGYGLMASAQSPYRANNQDAAPQARSNKGISRLTGAYTLVETRSDNVREMVESATANLSSSERDALMRWVELPEILAIDQRGQSITIASSLGRPVTVIADGRTRYSPNRRDTDLGVQASFRGDQLIVNTAGASGADYVVTFDPMDSGSHIRVTRSITSQRLSQPIVIKSVYVKSSNVAQLNLYKGNDYQRPARYSGSFYIQNGTQLIATLDTNLDTKRTRAGDRFSMIVESPSSYAGAIIEGYVLDSDRAGAFSGRADMMLNFERIRFRDGSAYNFAGQVISVSTPGGDDVRVDYEGEIEGHSQTKKTVKRTGIGAAFGAVIGAIAGGGAGAAIGSAVGAGAGAGSLFIKGRDDLHLPGGTQFTILASSPRTI